MGSKFSEFLEKIWILDPESEGPKNKGLQLPAFKKTSQFVGNIARHISKQIFKLELKNIFLFFLTVLFCYDVGESGLELKATQWGHLIY